MDNLGSGTGVDRMVFTFTSPRLAVLFGSSTRGGTAKVWVDGVRKKNLSFHAGHKAVKIDRTRRFGHLGSGSHKIKIEVTSGPAYIEGFTY
jgi:hypothetical protein